MTPASTFAEIDRAIAEGDPNDRPSLLVQLAARLAQLGAGLAGAPPARQVESEQLLSMDEVAQILHIPEDRARDLGREGALPTVNLGKYVRVRRATLDAWIREREQKVLAPRVYATYIPRHGRRGASFPAEVARVDPKGPRGARGRNRHVDSAAGAGGDRDLRAARPARAAAGGTRNDEG